MEKKTFAWKTKGMNRDSSVSAFSSEFSFENVNLRLSTKENNTTLSWVNEKGTQALPINSIDYIYNHDLYESSNHERGIVQSQEIHGYPVGIAILNNYLIIFTTTNTDEDSSGVDRIYRLEYLDDAKTSIGGVQLYLGNINLCIKSPLETMVSYEAEYIQKVYWTDGRNQPRVINIAADEEHIAKWEKNNYNLSEFPRDYFFDFVPAVNLNESVEIYKEASSGGTFAPGVIQYCFTYVNKYGQQSNVVYVSPLYYLAHTDRGASPEDKVNSSFTITIERPDENFDYVRLYAIQKTSLNLDAYVRLIDDISIKGAEVINNIKTIVYTDNGTTGSSVDPTELLFVGGKEITALTMTNKDNTLFLGNIEERNTLVTSVQNYFDNLRSNDNINIVFQADKQLILDHTTGIYSHTNTLNYNQREITTFKGGETYRFGFQLQKLTGEWSEPIYLKDEDNTVYPLININSDAINLVTASTDISLSNITDFDFSIYKRIRPVIVFPNISDRKVLCQGVLNPTVFNVEDRKDGYPFAQASWYFRPYMAANNFADSYIETISGTTNTIATEVASEQDCDITLDSNFTGYGKSVYILVADVTANTLNKILANGYITVEEYTFIHDYDVAEQQDNDINSLITDQHSLLGVISLGDNRYAFVSEIRWKEPEITERYYDESSNQDRESWIKYKDNLNTLRTNNQVFTIYRNINKSNNILYYTQNDGFPSTYVFKFYAGGTYYVVTFNTADTTEYQITLDNTSGNEIAFTHYESLYDDTTAAESGSEADRIEASKGIEIEGASRSYDSPYDLYENTNITKSNTQFFVDQSIVTLNSPDLEFDTEVQTYGTGGLKLRIVGAIPITANVSAHQINISTNMLEQNYSSHEDDSGTKDKCAFGTGEFDKNVLHKNIDLYAGKRLVSDLLWNDVRVDINNDKITTEKYNFYNYMVYPWQKEGSMNNDTRSAIEASSELETKKESNLLFSINSEYLSSDVIFGGLNVHPEVLFNNIEVAVTLTENQEIMNYRLKKQKSTSSEINYYPNIDKVLYREEGSDIIFHKISNSNVIVKNDNDDYYKSNSLVAMKYKSMSHFVIALDADNGIGEIPILPCCEDAYGVKTGEFVLGNSIANYDTFWGDTNMEFNQDTISIKDMFNGIPYNFLWLAELYKEPQNQFGGTSKNALRSNNWLIGGDSIDLYNDEGDLKASITLKWTTGDTYYQRYDCLKTYPFTLDDTNQLVEILSFMCETHVNIDGRYDKNRGQTQNYNMHPMNFNLHNPVYSQQDNYFVGKKIDNEDTDVLKYPNQIYYSMTKTPGADVDLYTNVTLASMLDLDGDKGKISAIRRLNDGLIAFQDSGIAQILYNENVQIATQAGVPIEIANSGKVQGKRYLSDMVGCSNKWSIASSPRGLYFMDSRNKTINLFNGQLTDLSTSQGFSTWANDNIPSSDVEWNPVDFDNFVAYYDRINQEVLFVSSDRALAYSEKTATFTSFYDYNVPYFCNLDDTGVWITEDGDIYKHQAGDYCNFFGVNKPYSITLVGNPEPVGAQVEKIFTNLQFTASVDTDGSSVANSRVFDFHLPFNYLEAWNEYQHGIANLSQKSVTGGLWHHSIDKSSALKRKFRLWNCDIPRDNAPISGDSALNISRESPRPLDRMRNPWIYLKLQRDAANEGNVLNRAEIHNILMTYFV